MKKVFVIIFVAVAVVACSRKTTPPAEIIISNEQKVSNNKSEIAVTNTNTGETSAGKSIYTTRCGRCHALKPVDKYKTTEWENILKIMIPKAKLTDAEAKEVTAYVMEHAKK